jgi:hypothetical protein
VAGQKLQTPTVLPTPKPVNWGPAITATAIGGLAYLLVAAFEEGYNVYYGVPDGFVQANIMSVFHVAALFFVAWEAISRGAPLIFWSSLLVFVTALCTLALMPVRQYWSVPAPLLFASLLNFALAFVFTPLVATLGATLMLLVSFKGLSALGRSNAGRATLFILFGEPAWQLKALILATYIMSPSFFLGYAYAAFATRYLVTTVQLASPPSFPNVPSEALVAIRFSNDIAIMMPYREVGGVATFPKCKGSKAYAEIVASIEFVKLGDSGSPSFDEATLCSVPLLVDPKQHLPLKRQSNWLCIRGDESFCDRFSTLRRRL